MPHRTGHSATGGRFPRQICANLEHGVLGHLFLREVPPFRHLPAAMSELSRRLGAGTTRLLRLRSTATPSDRVAAATGDPRSGKLSEDGAPPDYYDDPLRYGYPEELLQCVRVHCVQPPPPPARARFFLPRIVRTGKQTGPIAVCPPSAEWTVRD